MIASYLLSSTLVPVFSTWLMKEGASRRGARRTLRTSALGSTSAILAAILRFRWPLVLVYLGGYRRCC